MKQSVPDATVSGSTACVLLVQGHKLITANAGNSRAILVDRNRKVRELTEDHTPEVPAERRRIEQAGGRVAMKRTNFKKEASLHVQLSNKEKTVMGVTRSIGDFTARKIGVTSDPEIKHHNLEEDDQILILASDGIWEHMTVQNVAQIA